MQADLKALDREAVMAAQAHMGNFAWPTVLLTLGVALGTAGVLAAYMTGLLPLVPATVLFAVFTYMAYTPLHEAAHNNISANGRGRWVGELCGYIAAQLVILPHSIHRHEHMAHHRYTNVPGKDPDYLATHMSGGPLALVVGTGRFFVNALTWALREECTSTTRGDRIGFAVELLIAYGWRIALMTQMPLLDGVLLFVGGYVVALFFLVYWFAYRPHHPYEESARYRNTSSLIAPRWMKPVRWFWLGQDLHSIHHLFPRVPFYRYRELHNEIEPTLRAQGTPIIGMFDRQPVQPEGESAASEQAQAA